MHVFQRRRARESPSGEPSKEALLLASASQKAFSSYGQLLYLERGITASFAVKAYENDLVVVVGPLGLVPVRLLLSELS